MVLDVHTSVLVLLIIGWIGGSLALSLRLPRIIPMILLGIGIFPYIHPAVLYAPVTVTGGIATPDSQAPASSIRTMALLIALARGGLSLKGSIFRELGVPVVLLATLPYAAELIVEALVAPSFLPSWYGSTTPEGVAPSHLIVFASASVWAPLSPSIVIPNMLSFVDMGLTRAGHLVLTGAPLEVSTALVTEGVMSGCLAALNVGSDTTATLAHIPTYIIGSVLYGLAFAIAFYGYTIVRAHARVLARVGKADPSEAKLVFLVIFLLCYTTSIDAINTPWLIGFFAALCMAVGTQYLLPALADDLVTGLKPLWYFAECFLFVLTGCVIRPAIDAGYSVDLFGWFFAVLLLGQVARMCADILVAISWQSVLTKSYPHSWSNKQWGNVARRVAFVWFATMPKATLQASLGPKLTSPFKTAGALSASKFVAPASAIAILYCATLGSLLTFTAGKVIAVYFQEQHSDEIAGFASADGPSSTSSTDGKVIAARLGGADNISSSDSSRVIDVRDVEIAGALRVEDSAGESFGDQQSPPPTPMRDGDKSTYDLLAGTASPSPVAVVTNRGSRAFTKETAAAALEAR